jgi:Domain of unknown function (DUF4902)
MNITDKGLVLATVQELLALRLKHLHSATDADISPLPSDQRCGTVTTLSGYTEWVADASLPISVGWDWCIQAQTQDVRWQRDDLPRTNLQLMNEHGHALHWDDNLRVLATWVDAQCWQQDVARALGTALR